MARCLGRFDEVVGFATLDENIFAHHICACLPALDHDNGAWLAIHPLYVQSAVLPHRSISPSS